jgi:cAMP-dependent protein kinase regulator
MPISNVAKAMLNKPRVSVSEEAFGLFNKKTAFTPRFI